MTPHSTFQIHLGTTRPEIRASAFAADRNSKAFQVAKVIVGFSEVHFFIEDGEGENFAAALRGLANQIDNTPLAEVDQR